jgi:phosphopantetheine--protein transferase-like protein
LPVRAEIREVIRAIGIDVVEVKRIEQAMRRPGFVQRILTPDEMKHCATPQQVAGRWAAKEAAMKCLGSPATFRQIEIVAQADGRPVIHVDPAIAPADARWHVSITHERSYAAAVVVLECE